MISTSAAFLTTLAASHKIATRAEVWSGVTATNPGSLLTPLNVLSGSVKVDIANAIRRTADASLTDPTGTITPTSAGDYLTPYGNELRLFRGVTYNDGTTETVPLGVFGITTADVDDTGSDLTIKVTGMDRADRVSRALLTDTYPIYRGTNVATAIQALIAFRVPGLTYNFLTTTATTPLSVLETGDDPWAKALEMAKAIGADLFFDPFGVCTLALIVDTATAAATASFVEGPTATVLSLSRSFTNRATFSDVIAIGQGSDVDVPVRAQVQDTNPASPTYYLGPYGDVVTIYNSPLLLDVGQATAAAKALLYRQTGVAEQLSVRSLVNPAMDVGDVVQVTRNRLKIAARYSIDALTIPMSHDQPMEAIVRRRTT